MKSNVDTKHTIPALNDDMIWILGRPNFWCASVANVLRQDGQEIKTKAEHEQAAVIHWLLSLYLKHGEGWRDYAIAEAAKIKARFVASNVNDPSTNTTKNGE